MKYKLLDLYKSNNYTINKIFDLVTYSLAPYIFNFDTYQVITFAKSFNPEKELNNYDNLTLKFKEPLKERGKIYFERPYTFLG